MSTKTSNLSVAKIIFKDIDARIAKGTFCIDEITPNKKVTLNEFITQFLEYSMSHKAPKTFKRDRLALKNFSRFVGARDLDGIDHKLIDDYLNARVRLVSKATVNIELRHLKASFTKAVHWGHIEENPFRAVKPFLLPQRAPIYFTKEQLSELLRHMGQPWLRDVVIFLVNTGVRVGELVNLEWKDVDFAKRTFRISQKQNFVTKSRRERIIPMNSEVFDVLKNLKRKENRKGSYVFESPHAEKRCSLRISKSFKRCVREAGLGEQYTLHTLRHTFASYLVQAGVSLYIVSKLLGHSNIKTTEIYAHLAPETFHDAVSLINSPNRLNSTTELKLISGLRKIPGRTEVA
jgi:site-specific recombinase XerD